MDARAAAEKLEQAAKAREARDEARSNAIKILAEQNRRHLLALSMAEENRERRDRLRQGIEKNAALSVEQANATLGRLERLAQPIEPIGISLSMTIEASSDDDPYVRRLVALADKIVASAEGRGKEQRSFSFGANADTLPQKADGALYELIAPVWMFAFFDKDQTKRDIMAFRSGLSFKYWFGQKIAAISFDRDSKRIVFLTHISAIPPDDVGRSSRYVSSNDLVGGRFIIEPNLGWLHDGTASSACENPDQAKLPHVAG